jgi:hypothetical protein
MKPDPQNDSRSAGIIRYGIAGLWKPQAFSYRQGISPFFVARTGLLHEARVQRKLLEGLAMAPQLNADPLPRAIWGLYGKRRCFLGAGDQLRADIVVAGELVV